MILNSNRPGSHSNNCYFFPNQNQSKINSAWMIHTRTPLTFSFYRFFAFIFILTPSNVVQHLHYHTWANAANRFVVQNIFSRSLLPNFRWFCVRMNLLLRNLNQKRMAHISSVHTHTSIIRRVPMGCFFRSIEIWFYEYMFVLHLCQPTIDRGCFWLSFLCNNN